MINTTDCDKRHRCPRHQRPRRPVVEANRADGEQARLSHADHDGRRPSLAVGGETTSDQNVVTTGVLPTEIWDPTTETVDRGSADRCGPQLPFDRGVDGRRSGDVGRRRPPERLGRTRRSSAPRSILPPTCSTAPGQPSRRARSSPTTHHRGDYPRCRINRRGQPGVARRRHPPDRYESALCPAELHGRSALEHQSPARLRSPRPELHAVHREQEGRAIGRSVDQPGQSTPRSRRAHGVTATAGNGSATVSLDRAGQWQPPDHQLHRHPLHRLDARTPTVVSGNPPRRRPPRSPA